MLGLRIGAVISSENFPDDFPTRAAEELKKASPTQTAIINFELGLYYYSTVEDNDQAVLYFGLVLEYFRLHHSPTPLELEIDIDNAIFVLVDRWGRNLTSFFAELMDRPARDISYLKQGITDDLNQAAVIQALVDKQIVVLHPGSFDQFYGIREALRRAYRLFD